MELGNAFGGFSFADTKEIPITDTFSVTIKRAKSVQSYRMEIAKIQRRLANRPNNAVPSEFLTGSFKGDVALFHKNLLVSWTLTDAKTGEPIEASLENFANICLGKVKGVTPSQGKEFFDMLFQASHENDFFYDSDGMFQEAGEGEAEDSLKN